MPFYPPAPTVPFTTYLPLFIGPLVWFAIAMFVTKGAAARDNYGGLGFLLKFKSENRPAFNAVLVVSPLVSIGFILLAINRISAFKTGMGPFIFVIMVGGAVFGFLLGVLLFFDDKET